VANTAPGIYTLTQNGMGQAAILHANQTEVSSSSPAKPSETVILFMNGLGPVTPQVEDGVAAPSTPLSTSVESRSVEVLLDDGVNLGFGAVLFAGLAPGFAGLYQVNFTLPDSGLTNGDVHIALVTVEAENEMATINLSGFTETVPANVPSSRVSRRWNRAAAHAASGRLGKNVRRALPDRER
jgi:uncharacterized protein (TIGR03437 family)